MKERGFAILATMFAVTSLDLDDEGKRELARKVHADLGKIITYTNGPSLTFSMVERERRRGKTMDQTVFFVCVPPYIKEEKKKAIAQIIDNSIQKNAGASTAHRTVVYFCYHEDDDVGKDGLLYSDEKALEAQAK